MIVFVGPRRINGQDRAEVMRDDDDLICLFPSVAACNESLDGHMMKPFGMWALNIYTGETEMLG